MVGAMGKSMWVPALGLRVQTQKGAGAGYMGKN